MDFLHFKIFFIFFIVIIEGAVLRRRFKRYRTPPVPVFLSQFGISLDKFNTIVNESIPVTCSGSRVVRSLTLSTDSLQRLLIDKGGIFLPHLMATEDASARNFPNLLNLGTISNEENNVFPSAKSPIQKSQLEEDLRKWSSITNILQSANNSSRANTTMSNYLRDNFYYDNLTRTAKGESLPIETKSTANAIEHKISDFLVQNNITLDQLLNYIRIMKIKTHPNILMALEQHGNRRTKRNTDGSETTKQYCLNKGSSTHASFLSLCGECAVTTKLPADRFPRLLNEAICGDDLTCLNINQKPQGACLQSETHLTLLRRRPGGCRMSIHTGEKVYVDEWETYTQKVRTGCNCAIDKRSYLVGHYNPFG